MHKIGILDSGIGGLTICSYIFRVMPDVNILYFADTLNAPYGSKSRREVYAAVKAGVSYLFDAGCDEVVIACNTATTTCICELRGEFSKPIIGTEPELKNALSGAEKPLLLATPKPEGVNAVVLDGVQDSGNVGTIIRTAVGAGFSDVYLVDSADAFSPKTVRASMGAVLRANVIKARAEELEDYLTGYDKVAMDMGGDDVFSYRPKRKVAIIVGNEAHGLSDFARKFSDVTLSIPMQGGQESLNVAVAAGIAMYVINHNSNI